MKAYAIVIKDMEVSEFAFGKLKESSFKVKNSFEIKRFDAVVPNDVDNLLKTYNIEWNYPWEGNVSDFATGLTKSAYVTAQPKARIAAALSHYTLWMKASMLDEPILILEHDAYFTTRYDLKETKGDIIGINNPLGCTRKSKVYYNTIIQGQEMFQRAPTIDDITVPQGLAGNSAYIIKPQGAKHMLNLVKEYGLWPNDALMCKQLVPNLYVTRKFFTTVQHTRSTTTL
jgi:GR25 family glycosyltransferase involved in LPS biosynthesis